MEHSDNMICTQLIPTWCENDGQRPEALASRAPLSEATNFGQRIKIVSGEIEFPH
jgi:hypothetical protein